MPKRNVAILATIGVGLIFAMLVQIFHLAFAREPSFAHVTYTQRDDDVYNDVLLKYDRDFWSLSNHSCDNSMSPTDIAIQYQKGYSGYAKSYCGSVGYVLSSSLNLSSLVPGLISSAPYSKSQVTAKTITDSQPVIADPNLKVETVFKGDNFPSSMAFLGPNDILLLQKNDGTVERIVNGTLNAKPLLHVNVATEQERGMLGAAAATFTSIKNETNYTQPETTYVFLYFKEEDDSSSNGNEPGGNVIGITKKPKCNCLYRYELSNNRLVNPKLLLSLPATPGPQHNGGRMLIGPDNDLYLTIGDLRRHRTESQNFENGTDPDGTSGILRITQDGKPVGKGIIGDNYPLNLYYAYGIRNSFGIDFDPVTKKLWDTENGPDFGDEINLVEPGFNSGWMQVQGIWKPVGSFPPRQEGPVATNPERGLVDFGGKGKYRPPELIWNQTIGPTALKFLNSSKLGKQYENDMFVGDFNNGNLYRFKLNDQRNGLLLLPHDSIHDNIVYNGEAQLPANWTDPFRHCVYNFECMVNPISGWQNIKTSFQVSTISTDNGTWSYIVGKEIDVKPNERYALLTHMKLNEFARASHIAIEGYNETSKRWNQLYTQCPPGTNGPLEWKEFSCEITIPANTVKIRPVLNAGWSSEKGKEAITLFDAIHLNQIMARTSKDNNNNLVSNPDFAQITTFGHGNILFGYGFGPITDIQVGPDGYLYVLSIQMDLGYPYESPVKETIYRIIPASQ